MAMKWYVIQAYSGYEEKVKRALEERIRRSGLEHKFGRILVPQQQAQQDKAAARRPGGARAFYPGYVFVEMELDESTWHVVRGTPKVAGFVGGSKPVPVPDSEIEAVSRQLAEGKARARPRVVFEPGDQVRVIDGAFANFTGTVEEVNEDKQKVRVLVSIFGRSTPVELDFSQVEKVRA